MCQGIRCSKSPQVVLGAFLNYSYLKELDINFLQIKFSNNIEIIVKNISKGYNRSMKTVPTFIKQPRK